jgi:hypothetical protein
MKTYLNVPFALKDAAKALGAKWDPIQKKWYVPADKDQSLFEQWQEVIELTSPSVIMTGERGAGTGSNNSASDPKGAITLPSNKNFVPYDGDQPPWD